MHGKKEDTEENMSIRAKESVDRWGSFSSTSRGTFI